MKLVAVQRPDGTWAEMPEADALKQIQKRVKPGHTDNHGQGAVTAARRTDPYREFLKGGNS